MRFKTPLVCLIVLGLFCLVSSFSLAQEVETAQDLVNKGFSLYRFGKYKEALSCYDKALELNPKNANAWINKGLYLYDFDRYEEAIKCYDKAIKIDPNLALAWAGKGASLYELKRYKEAKECIKRAKALSN
jgi:tetratricopeptide (TPR) repeat protein